MPDEFENIDSGDGYNGRRINGPAVIGAGAAVVTALGSMVWFVVTMHGAVVDNTRWLQDQQRVIDNFIQQQNEWNKEEKSYDLEVRSRLNEVDKTRQEAFRSLWEKVTEMLEKCRGQK